MKASLYILVFTMISLPCISQCTISSILKKSGSGCAGIDSLWVSSTGTLTSIKWYNGNQLDTIVRIDTVVKEVTVAGGNGTGSALNQFWAPDYLYIDKNDNLYVCDQNCRVIKFPPGSTSATNGELVAGDGTCGFSIIPGAPFVATNRLLGGPRSLVVDDSGYIYIDENVVGPISVVQKFPPNTTGSSKGIPIIGVPGNVNGMQAIVDSNGINNSAGICLDQQGNIFISDSHYNRVEKFPSNSTTGTYGNIVAGNNDVGTAANQFDNPTTILVDKNGYLYVCDQGNNRIQKFSPHSNSTTNGITVAGGNGPGSAANQLNMPVGFCIDSNGNLYVDDYMNGRIQKFPPGSSSSTNGVTVFSTGGYGLLLGLNGVSVDSKGAIYFLDYGNGDQVQKLSTVIGIDSVYVPTVPGTYRAVVTDSTGCTDTTNAMIISSTPATSVSIRTNHSIICAGDTAMFTAIPVNGGDSPMFSWFVNGWRYGSTDSTIAITSLQNGDVVHCSLSSSLTCAGTVYSTNSINMVVNPVPTIQFNPDTLILKPGENTTLNPMISGAISQYNWTPATGLDDPSKQNPVASPAMTTVYQLLVSSYDGCKASGNETVIVYSTLVMPAAFSPNGDGKNDMFRIPPGSPQRIQSFTVYDRFGQQIFTTSNSSEGWDGNYQHTKQPVGNYAWVIKYTNMLTGKQQIATGSVLLVR